MAERERQIIASSEARRLLFNPNTIEQIKKVLGEVTLLSDRSTYSVTLPNGNILRFGGDRASHGLNYMQRTHASVFSESHEGGRSHRSADAKIQNFTTIEVIGAEGDKPAAVRFSYLTEKQIVSLTVNARGEWESKAENHGLRATLYRATL